MEAVNKDSARVFDHSADIGSIPDRVRSQMESVVEDVSKVSGDRYLPIPRWIGSDPDGHSLRFRLSDETKLIKEICVVRDPDTMKYRVSAEAFFRASRKNHEIAPLREVTSEEIEASSKNSVIKEALLAAYTKVAGWTVNDLIAQKQAASKK